MEAQDDGFDKLSMSGDEGKEGPCQPNASGDLVRFGMPPALRSACV